MLLEFKMKNFKSFKEEMVFKMVSSQIKDLEHSLISKNVNGKRFKILSSAIIYGPNSSGKTNIMCGMEVLRSIILTGNIQNKENNSSLNTAVEVLELIPNIENDEKEPVYFYIKFLAEDMIIEYKLLLELGSFLDMNYDRKILNEELHINNSLIYKRDTNLKIGKIEIIKEYLIENFSKETAEKIAKTNLDDKELFLNGMFKTLYSKRLFDIIYNWFRLSFRIVYHSDKLHIYPITDENEKEKKLYVDKTLNEAVRDFGLTSEKIAYPINTDEKVIEPVSVIEKKASKERIVLPAEVFESFGTIRFLNIFPLVVSAIENGITLVIDEFDASIHPMAIMNIINIFHNDEINTKGAQLIFNTHNPIFLNNSLLRRDEIKFVEKEENGSIHYSLSDFGTNGKNGVRNKEDYMKNYFVSKYGAIKDIDFTEIFIKKQRKDE